MDYPTTFSTADILVYDADGNYILGRKEKDGSRCRLPGGFVDPALDTCYLDAAVREAFEELKFNFEPFRDEFVYLGDFPIEDERYRDTEHNVITNLYAVQIPDLSVLSAGDDLKSIHVFNPLSVAPRGWILENHIIEEHRELMKVALDYLKHADLNEYSNEEAN